MTSGEITPYEKLLENLLERVSVTMAEFCISVLSYNGHDIISINVEKYENKLKEYWAESVMANKLFFITRKTFEMMRISPLKFLQFLQDEILAPIWSSRELSIEELTEMLKKLKEVSNICN